MSPMTYEQWKAKVGDELARIFGWSCAEGQKYVADTDDGETWRDMFDDGLTPDQAASEEALAATTP